MLDLSTKKKTQVGIEFDFAGDTVKAQILPFKLTPTYRSQLQLIAKQQPTEGEEAKDGNAALVSDLMVSWDVLNEGEPCAPTYENLRDAPDALLSRIAEEILAYVGKLVTKSESKD